MVVAAVALRPRVRDRAAGVGEQLRHLVRRHATALELAALVAR